MTYNKHIYIYTPVFTGSHKVLFTDRLPGISVHLLDAVSVQLGVLASFEK